jgi:hypothetical protein
MRELHASAGYPPSTFMADAIKTYQPYVSNLLSGRRMPPWPVVRALGALLAELSNVKFEPIERALRAMYTEPPATD